eukprot:scaffold2611_cov114-Isochrysis_galbana.AAC.5
MPMLDGGCRGRPGCPARLALSPRNAQRASTGAADKTLRPEPNMVPEVPRCRQVASCVPW